MLVSEAIKAAYRENNLIVIGEEPTDDELAEGLALLNTFRLKLFGSDFGENLADWPVPPPNGQGGIPDYLVSPDMGLTWFLVPQSNVRLLVAVQAATTIKMPESPDDGARIRFIDVGSAAVDVTLSGNGRLIEGQPYLLDTAQAFNGVEWFYRADLASWERVQPLELDDELPLPREYDDLFITYLAIRLSPRNSQTAGDDTRAYFKALLSQAKARYRQEQSTAIADRAVSQTEQSFGRLGSLDWFGV